MAAGTTKGITLDELWSCFWPKLVLSALDDNVEVRGNVVILPVVIEGLVVGKSTDVWRGITLPWLKGDVDEDVEDDINDDVDGDVEDDVEVDMKDNAENEAEDDVTNLGVTVGIYKI